MQQMCSHETGVTHPGHGEHGPAAVDDLRLRRLGHGEDVVVAENGGGGRAGPARVGAELGPVGGERGVALGGLGLRLLPRICTHRNK